MHIFKNLTEPTAVTHCLSCNFTGERNLVMVKGAQLLQIFRYKDDIATKDGAPRLELITEYYLDGTVTGLTRIKTVDNYDVDSLYISVKHAKAVIVAWNAGSFTLDTKSLHYYEKGLIESNFFEPECSSVAVSDEANSFYTCLLFQNDRMAFLPIIEKGLDEDEMPDSGQVFDPSFIVKASKLDKRIENVMDICFLHEYRETTMGILFQPKRAWVGMKNILKDTVSYAIVSVDVHQKNSTVIGTLNGLPVDAQKVIPLPAPLGGSLIICANTILYIDSSASYTGVMVNNTHRQNSDLVVSRDQSSLDLRLEGAEVCFIQELGNTAVLVTEDGQFFSLLFNKDGRRVASLELRPIEPDDFILSQPSSVAAGPDGTIFLGSRAGDSLLVKWYHGEAESQPDEPMDDGNESDDDLYGGDTAQTEDTTNRPLKLRLADRMLGMGPMQSLALGKNRSSRGVEFVTTTGVGANSALAILTSALMPYKRKSLYKDMPGGQFWSVPVRFEEEGEVAKSRTYVVSSDSENSYLFYVDAAGVIEDVSLSTKKKKTKKHFVSNVPTIFSSSMLDSALLQVCSETVNIYDAKIGQPHKYSLPQGTTAVEARVLDNYVFVLLSDGQVKVLEAVSINKRPFLKAAQVTIEPASESKAIGIYATHSSLAFGAPSKKRTREGSPAQDSRPVVVVCYTDGSLLLQGLNSDDRLILDASDLSGFIKEKDGQLYDVPLELVDIALSPLGDDNILRDYLVLLTPHQLVVYEPYHFNEELRFRKIFLERTPTINSDRRLAQVPLINGKHTLGVTGETAFILVKTLHTSPRLIEFGEANGAVAFTSWDGKFTYLTNDGEVAECRFDPTFSLETNLPVKHVPLCGETISKVTYHETMDVYVIATHKTVPHVVRDEDDEVIDSLTPDVMPATTYQGAIRIVNPFSWTVIDSYEFEMPAEAALCCESVKLSISDRKSQKREVVAVGTTILRGEDLAARGALYLFDVIEIVPEKERPETNRRLKKLVQDRVRGAFTAVCEVSGRLLAVQGQKLLVQALQDDLTLVPVAFLDMQTYVAVAKSLNSMLLLGDATRSVQFVGFSMDPYQMIPFARDLQRVLVTTCDFAIEGENLTFVVADLQKRLHILEYDPDDPQSYSGGRLLRRSVFYSGKVIDASAMVPINEERFMVIGVCSDGSVTDVVPCPEDAYRRLYAIQTQITDKEAHICGLHPRAYRYDPILPGTGNSPHRPILDGHTLIRFANLPRNKQSVYANRLGQRYQQLIWKDLELISDLFKKCI